MDYQPTHIPFTRIYIYTYIIGLGSPGTTKQRKVGLGSPGTTKQRKEGLGSPGTTK